MAKSRKTLSLKSNLLTGASAKVVGKEARNIDAEQRVKAFLAHTHEVVAKEGYHDLIIPLDPSREPTPDEVKKIIMASWEGKVFLDQRVANCKYAINEDKTSGLRCLVVQMKKWAGE